MIRRPRLTTPARAVERLLFAATVLLPLICWPGLDRPFSIPKLWLIAGLDLLVLLHTQPRQIPGWPWLAWLAAVGASALTAPHVSLEALLLLLLPLGMCGSGEPSLRALTIASAVEAALAVVQFAGLDPFLWLGWRPEAFASARMRVYGTLGNPDFVAAWLCATLPIRPARGPLQAARVALHLAGIFATGSRVFLLALPAAAAAAVLRGGRFRKWWLGGLPVAIALLWFSSARPLGVTVQGRLFLARVTFAHLLEVPPAGFGPGSYALKFSEWQAGWLREHRQDAQFAGPVDHAHNDYLEFWIEYGPLGLCAFLVLCGWLLARAWRSGAPEGVLAGLAALLAIAAVDFPFHRPAEWTLFWILICFTGQRRRQE